MNDPEAENMGSRLAEPPRKPVEVNLFSSNTLFGQPGIYPEGSQMQPAKGEPMSEREARELFDPRSTAAIRFESESLRYRAKSPQLRAAFAYLSGTPGDPLLAAFLRGESPVEQFRVGPLASEGRVIGQPAEPQVTAPSASLDPARILMLNERYCAEHPIVVAASLAHALFHHGNWLDPQAPGGRSGTDDASSPPPMASNAEEATLHGVVAAIHAWLIAMNPDVGDPTTELARRQNSLAITLLNARSPGSLRPSIVCPDGPGTIPEGNPDLQCPDLWSVPFTQADLADCDLNIPQPIRTTLQNLASDNATRVPRRYDSELGSWLQEETCTGSGFSSATASAACSELGLFGTQPG